MSFNVKKSSPGNLVHMDAPKRHISLGLTGVPVPKPLVALPTHCRFFFSFLHSPPFVQVPHYCCKPNNFFSVPRRRIGRLPFPRFPTLRRPWFPVCGFFAVRNGMSPWAPKKTTKKHPKIVCASFPLDWHRPAGDELVAGHGQGELLGTEVCMHVGCGWHGSHQALAPALHVGCDDAALGDPTWTAPRQSAISHCTAPRCSITHPHPPSSPTLRAFSPSSSLLYDHSSHPFSSSYLRLPACKPIRSLVLGSAQHR